MDGVYRVVLRYDIQHIVENAILDTKDVGFPPYAFVGFYPRCCKVCLRRRLSGAPSVSCRRRASDVSKERFQPIPQYR